MSQWLSTLLLIFLVASLLPAQSASTLTVAAASDLSSLEPELAAAFRKVEPNIDVHFVTAASAMLMQQIESKAPYDVFLSANAQFVDRLGSNGTLLSSSVMSYAVGRVAVLWRDGKRHPLSDLKKTWVRIVALPNPKLAPYGVAAQQALEHAGLWEFVRQKAVYGENVRQTLQMLESGNADAVLTSDALLQGRNAELIPADWHQPIVQKAGIVAASTNQDGTRKFLSFITGPAGQAVFAKYGFSPP